MFQLLFTFVLILLSANGKAENLSKVANDPAWLSLLHYQRNFWGQMKSRIKNPSFFLSEIGNENPEDELRKTLQAFRENKVLVHSGLPATCTYPARARFLLTHFPQSFNLVACEKLMEVLKPIHPIGLSLIFSSASAGSPASLFGHTFLKIISNRRSDLLNYGISYAASVGSDENTLVFLISALLGSYRGRFSLIPYYLKVNEYSNSESRELWEYELSFSPSETQMLIEHLWELELNAEFSYYFMDDNCAFQILSLIEAIKPKWKLTENWFFVTPLETIKRLAKVEGAIVKRSYRPSLKTKLLGSYEALDLAGQDQLKEIRSKSDEISPSVLDTAILQLQFEKQREGKLSSNNQAFLDSLLTKRSKRGDSPEILIKKPVPPERAHAPSRVGLATGFQNSSTFFEWNLKSAFHDLLNQDFGYLPYSEFDFPEVTLRWVPDLQSFYLQNLTFFRATSFSPLYFLEKKLSWTVRASYDTPKDFGCLECHMARFEVGIGLSVSTFSEKAIAYFFLINYAEAGSIPHFRGGMQSQIGFLGNPSDPYKYHLQLGQAWDGIHPLYFQTLFEHSIALAQNIEIRNSNLFLLSEAHNLSYSETKLGVNFYF